MAENQELKETEETRENQVEKENSAVTDDLMFIPGDPNNTYLPPPVSEGDEEQLNANKSKFRRIWDRYSYTAVKLYLTQFAIGLFGAAMGMATAKDKGTLFLVMGIFSVFFFVVMTHSVAWNAGAQDRISVDVGKRKRNLFTGVLLGLAAGIPNFLLATIYTLTYLGGAHNIAAVAKVVMMFSEGMYWSFINYFSIGGQALHLYWWVYFLMAICSVFFITLSYLTGYFNLKFTNILVDKSVEAQRAAEEKRKGMKPKK